MILESSAWYVSRAAGLVAYALLWGSIIWGIMATSKPFTKRVSKAAILDWHRILSTSAMAFTVLHAAVLLLNKHAGFGLADLIIPFHYNEDSVAVALGVLSMELGLVVGVSIKFKKVIGQKVWRAIHFVSYPVFLMAFLHFIAIGTDAKNPVVLGIALMSGLSVVFATAFRVVYRPTRAERNRADLPAGSTSAKVAPERRPEARRVAENR